MPNLKPLATAPGVPQLYSTDVGPKEVFGAALTEVFRVKVAEDKEKEMRAQGAWGEFVKGLKGGEVVSSSGVSLNAEEKTFLGVLGWESGEVRERVLKGKGVEELKEKLGEVDSFVVKFNAL